MFLTQFLEKERKYFNDSVDVCISYSEMPDSFLAAFVPIVRQDAAVSPQKVEIFNHPDNPNKRNNFGLKH